MKKTFIITGTDTDVGKTVFAAALLAALNKAGRRAAYWKPVQCGLEGGVDARIVQKMTGLPDDRFFPERYIFSHALSPHRAAELENAQIEIDALEVPEHEGILLIEGAGGLMVPLTRATLLIDLFALWRLPVILCARTGLGTLNHTLLSVEALRAREIPLHGIAFVGEKNDDNMRTIADLSGSRVLGRLPPMEALGPETLAAAFDENFTITDFCDKS